MIRINFLQEQKPTAARSKAPPLGWVIGAAVLVGVGGMGLYGLQVASLHALQQEVASTQAQSKEVQGRVAQATALRKQEESLSAQLQSGQALRGRTWSSVLLGFVDETPKGLSWHEVKADDHQIDLAGYAQSLADIAQFLAELSTDANVQGVTLHDAKEADGRYAFTLTIGLKPRPGQQEGGHADGHQ